MVILRQDCHGKGNSRKFYLNLDGEKVPNRECLFVRRKQGLFLSEYVDDINMAGKKQKKAPMWKKMMIYLECAQRECKPNEIFQQHKEMFESRISAGATEKLPGWEKPHAKRVAWSYDMHGRTCSKMR